MNLEAEAVWSDAEASLDPRIRDVYQDLKRAPIEIVACAMDKSINHGGILRAAEAFRIERVTFQQEPDFATDFSGHRGSLKWQPYRWRDPLEAVLEAKEAGRHIYGLSLEPDSVSIDSVEWQFPMVLVFGSEKWGIRPDVLSQCDTTIAIPMFGAMTSLNVAVAGAITMQKAVMAYHLANPDFVPIRGVSAALLGSGSESPA